MSASLPPVLGVKPANGAVQSPAKADKTIQGFPTIGGSLGAQDNGVAIVNGQIVPGKLTEGVLFNAPQPNIQDYALGKDLAIPNTRGFMVSDPVWRSQVRDAQSTWASWNDNFGFRFAYNPETYQEQYTVEQDSDPILAVRSAAIGAFPVGLDTGVTVSLNLTLYRGEDMSLLAGDDYQKYYNGITSEQRDTILARGTQADIEHLFRLCNGSPIETWRGKTSDWGMLLPSIVVLSLSDYVGTRRIRARITTVSWTHKLFAPGMIPIHTEMTLELARMSDGYYQAGKDVGTSADPGTGGSGVQSGTTDTTSGSNTDTANSASGRLNLGGGLSAGDSPFEDYARKYESLVGRSTLPSWSGGGSYSVGHMCLRNTQSVWKLVGGRNTSAYGSAAAAGQAYRRAGKLSKYVASQGVPRGYLVFWDSGIGGGAGHVAMSDGKGNTINNWGGGTIVRTKLKTQATGNIIGWGPPTVFGPRKK